MDPRNLFTNSYSEKAYENIASEGLCTLTEKAYENIASEGLCTLTGKAVRLHR